VEASDGNLGAVVSSLGDVIGTTNDNDPISGKPVKDVFGVSVSAGVITIAPVLAALKSSCPGPAGIWSGYLDVPQTGFYNIYVATDPNAEVTLEIGDEAIAMAAISQTYPGIWSNQARFL